MPTNPDPAPAAPREALDLEAIKARTREYIRLVGVGYTKRFEVQAERFYRETGFMAPGKSVPLEMHQDEHERARKWGSFQQHEREQYQADLSTLLAEVERFAAMREAAPASPRYDVARALRELIQSVRVVLRTFEEDEEAGYRSKDRQFAIEILNPAVRAAERVVLEAPRPSVKEQP